MMTRATQLLTASSTLIWLSAVAQAAPRPATPPGHAQYTDHDGGSSTAQPEQAAIPEGARCDPAGRGERIMEWLHDGTPFNGGGSYGTLFMSANVSRWSTPGHTSTVASTMSDSSGQTVEVGPPSPPSNPPANPPAHGAPVTPVVAGPSVTAPTVPGSGAPTLGTMPGAANVVLAPGAGGPVTSAAITTPNGPVTGAALVTRPVEPNAITAAVPSPTPEPATLLLLTGGGIGLATIRRRRRARAGDR